MALGVLNQHLLTRTYLVGERITLADICVACNLLSLYQWASIVYNFHIIISVSIAKFASYCLISIHHLIQRCVAVELVTKYS